MKSDLINYRDEKRVSMSKRHVNEIWWHFTFLWLVVWKISIVKILKFKFSIFLHVKNVQNVREMCVFSNKTFFLSIFHVKWFELRRLYLSPHCLIRHEITFDISPVISSFFPFLFLFLLHVECEKNTKHFFLSLLHSLVFFSWAHT